MRKTLFALFLIFLQTLIATKALSTEVYFDLIKEFSLNSEPSDIILYDNAYVITSGSLYSITISDPYNAVKNEIRTLSGLNSIAFIGHFGYVSYGLGNIVVYDFSKSPPLKTNTIFSSGRVEKLVIDNGYLYVINLDAGLQVYDVNVADFPVFKNTQIITGVPNGLIVKNKKAYITSSDAHLSIIDAADISKLPIIGTYTNGVEFYEPFVDGNFAYVPQGKTGVQVLNINVLPFPTWVANLYSRKFAKQVITSGVFVWVADDKSIEAFFNNKSDGFYFAGNYKNNSIINRIAIIDDKFVYLATADKKLKVLRIDYQYQ